MTEKEKYRNEMNALTFSEDFEQRTAELMRQRAGEEYISLNKRKTLKIAIAVAVAAIMMTGTAFALSFLLTPKEVAEQVGQNAIAAAFESEDAILINETVSAGGYNFTLMGIASGTRLDAFNDMPVESSRSYIVLAIERADGTAIQSEDELLTVDGNQMISISPFVSGWQPHLVNAWSLGTSANGLTRDGIRYYLYDCASLEMFADHTVYLGIYEGFAPTNNIIVMAENGDIVYAEGYNGIKAMFTLPLDPADADPEKVEALLNELGVLGAAEEDADEESATSTANSEDSEEASNATTATAPRQ